MASRSLRTLICPLARSKGAIWFVFIWVVRGVVRTIVYGIPSYMHLLESPSIIMRSTLQSIVHSGGAYVSVATLRCHSTSRGRGRSEAPNDTLSGFPWEDDVYFLEVPMGSPPLEDFHGRRHVGARLDLSKVPMEIWM